MIQYNFQKEYKFNHPIDYKFVRLALLIINSEENLQLQNEREILIAILMQQIQSSQLSFRYVFDSICSLYKCGNDAEAIEATKQLSSLQNNHEDFTFVVKSLNYLKRYNKAQAVVNLYVFLKDTKYVASVQNIATLAWAAYQIHDPQIFFSWWDFYYERWLKNSSSKNLLSQILDSSYFQILISDLFTIVEPKISENFTTSLLTTFKFKSQIYFMPIIYRYFEANDSKIALQLIKKHFYQSLHIVNLALFFVVKSCTEKSFNEKIDDFASFFQKFGVPFVQLAKSLILHASVTRDPIFVPAILWISSFPNVDGTPSAIKNNFKPLKHNKLLLSFDKTTFLKLANYAGYTSNFEILHACILRAQIQNQIKPNIDTSMRTWIEDFVRAHALLDDLDGLLLLLDNNLQLNDVDFSKLLEMAFTILLSIDNYKNIYNLYQIIREKKYSTKVSPNIYSLYIDNLARHNQHKFVFQIYSQSLDDGVSLEIQQIQNLYNLLQKYPKNHYFRKTFEEKLQKELNQVKN